MLIFNYDHIFFEGAMDCISLVGQGPPADQTLYQKRKNHCLDVEVPEQKNVWLGLMQHVVNPPEEGVTSIAVG